ncbi:hypothetical protein M6B38_221525 [Iris pallida]|uniref:Uncharacterized protein n=1 Tax=Iris pallida TaxID=29817 RepID=A0AAX6DW45_IRIPA|nr:hypothetical protein M6B38_221525 [Iris pallida]
MSGPVHPCLTHLIPYITNTCSTPCPTTSDTLSQNPHPRLHTSPVSPSMSVEVDHPLDPTTFTTRR